MNMSNFRVLKKLGQGAFGEVFLCETGSPPRQVAIKILRISGDLNLRRFYREVEILHREITNPYVVNLLAFNLDIDPPYLVMEFCEGGSLRSWVGSRQPWPRVARIIAQAAMGLHGIHQKGGFHRDIKPDNILLATSSGEIAKLGDFGIARIPYTGSTAMTRSAMGTPHYMAPELMYGAPYTEAADVYSLGITTIELLTGSLDWKALDQVTLPPELHRLLLSMIDRDPRVRPSAGEVSQNLQSLIHRSLLISQPSVLSKPTTPNQVPKNTGMTGGGWLLGGLAALAGILLIAKGRDDETWWDPSVQRYRGPDGRFQSG